MHNDHQLVKLYLLHYKTWYCRACKLIGIGKLKKFIDIKYQIDCTKAAILRQEVVIWKNFITNRCISENRTVYIMKRLFIILS